MMELHVVVFILCLLLVDSKGTLTDKKCQQTLVIDVSCNTAKYTDYSFILFLAYLSSWLIFLITVVKFLHGNFRQMSTSLTTEIRNFSSFCYQWITIDN